MFRPYKPRDYASTKEVVTRTLDQAGGIKKAAHLLGRSPTQTTAYSDPAAPDEISFDQVRRLVIATGAPTPGGSGDARRRRIRADRGRHRVVRRPCCEIVHGMGRVHLAAHERACRRHRRRAPRRRVRPRIQSSCGYRHAKTDRRGFGAEGEMTNPLSAQATPRRCLPC